MPKERQRNLEIVVKFFLTDLASIRRKVAALGAEFTPKVFESNVRYEDQAHQLKSRGMLLRLRKDNRVRLTVKTPPSRANSDVKVMRELEVTVDDFTIMDQILTELGFHQVQIYEKWRETAIVDQIHICLDTLPFGHFLEIEGSIEEIRSTTIALKLDWRKRITSNYLEIFEHLKKTEQLKFNQVTFANFEKHPVQFETHRHLFEPFQSLK